MHRTGKWFLYALFVLVVAGLFLYLRFPERIVRQYLVRQATAIFSPYDLTISAVRPAFPPGLILQEIRLQHDGQEYTILERLKITPAYASLFSPGRNFILTAGVYGGRITSKINLSRGDKAPQVLTETTLVNIDLGKAAWLPELIRRDISGRLSGKAFGDTANIAEPFKARLQIADGLIGLQVPVFSLENFTFNLVETDFTLNRKRMLIKRCTLSGEQLEGNFSGSINLRSPLGKSLLSLSGTFKMQPEFTQHMQKNLPEGLLSPKKAAAGYPLRFSGTLDKPGFSLK